MAGETLPVDFEVSRVLFLGICLDFYFYLGRVLLPEFGFVIDRESVSQALVEPCLGLAIPTRGDKPNSPAIFQHLTNELDRETIPVFIDEPDHFLTLCAWFRREKAEAAFSSSLVSRGS